MHFNIISVKHNLRAADMTILAFFLKIKDFMLIAIINSCIVLLWS